MIVSKARRMTGSFEESTREEEDVQEGKEAQATVCEWKPEGQDQSWKKQRKGVRAEVWCQDSEHVFQMGGSSNLGHTRWGE